MEGEGVECSKTHGTIMKVGRGSIQLPLWIDTRQQLSNVPEANVQEAFPYPNEPGKFEH